MGVNRIDRGSDFGQSTDPGGRSTQHPSHGTDRFDVGSEISDLANLMNQLQQLLLSDAARFERVVSSIADRLRAETGTETSPRALALSQLADQFQGAARNGNLPALQTPTSASGQPHPLHGIRGYGRQQPPGAGGDPIQPLEELARVIQNALANTA